jgi:hypothetical protein
MNLQSIVLLAQAANEAIKFLCNAEGMTEAEAIKRLLEHLLPGKPNDPVLGDH